MKHVKSYRIFEAEVRKEFTDWLKDPKAPTHTNHKYKFEFLVKKVFKVDEGNWDPDAIAEYLRNERGDNLYRQVAQDLSGNYSSVAFDEEEDDEEHGVSLSERDVKANFSEYFEEWINQEYNQDMGKFYRMYDLDFEDDEITDNDFHSLKESFNEDDLEQHYTAKEYNQDFTIIDMEVTDLVDKNIVVGTFETDRELSEDEVESVKDYLSGQCSDGWGEGFSQQQEKETISGVRFYMSISVWWGEGHPEWYLNISRIS